MIFMIYDIFRKAEIPQKAPLTSELKLELCELPTQLWMQVDDCW